MAETIAFNAAEQVAPMLRENFGKTEHTTKSNERDWVTKWDNLAEEEITRLLAGFSEDVGFLAEETGASGSQDVYWTIDAIDGTSGFVRGIDTCTTMISLVDSGRPVVGVINDFMRDIPYTAVAGVGAFQNQVKRLSVSQRPMKTAYVETYVPLDVEEGVEINKRLRTAGAFILQTASSGHLFTSIARGATEGFVSYQNPFATIWDYAPGALLVHEAGGIVQNIGSDRYSVNNPDLVASNKFCFDALRDAVKDL